MRGKQTVDGRYSRKTTVNVIETLDVYVAQRLVLTHGVRDRTPGLLIPPSHS